MPDDAGNLTPQEEKRFIDWLNKKWRNEKKCTVCTHNNWFIHKEVVTHAGSITSAGANLKFGGYPIILMACRNCGHTLSFNALLAGVFMPSEGGGDG